MTAPRGGNRAKIQRLALAIAAGRKVAEAARDTGVSDRTASRLMRDPRFVRMVHRIHAEVRQAVVGQLTTAASEAVVALRDLLRDTTPPTARVSAARALLEHAERSHQTLELEQRIQALEAVSEGESSHGSKEPAASR